MKWLKLLLRGVESVEGNFMVRMSSQSCDVRALLHVSSIM